MDNLKLISFIIKLLLISSYLGKLIAVHTSHADLREKVYQKLATTFGNDGETLSRVMFYLDEEERTYENIPKTSPFWRTMKNALNSDIMFKEYALRLAEDTKKAETNGKFREVMGLMYELMLGASTNKGDVSLHQGFDVNKFADPGLIEKTVSIAFVKNWAMIPASAQKSILNFITFVPNTAVVKEVVGKASNPIITVTLSLVNLGWDVIKSINRWWKGEITGIRCTKIIVDSALSTTAFAAGSLGGAAFGGSVAGPFGFVVGGIVGGIASSAVASGLSDRMTQSLFGIPKEEALENAYNYFGLKMDASNHEINSAYREACLKHHPDKGGNSENFYLAQVNMQVIKAAKGDS